MKRKTPTWINSELVWVQIFQLEGHSFLDKNAFDPNLYSFYRGRIFGCKIN